MDRINECNWDSVKIWKIWGMYAHSDISMELAYWKSAEFELYIRKLFLRLKYLTNGNRRPNDEMER